MPKMGTSHQKTLSSVADPVRIPLRGLIPLVPNEIQSHKLPSMRRLLQDIPQKGASLRFLSFRSKDSKGSHSCLDPSFPERDTRAIDNI